MDKEKCLLDFSQKLGLACKEENTSITFCCCVQNTYFKKFSPPHKIKWNQLNITVVFTFMSNCLVVTSLILLIDQMSYKAVLLYFLLQMPLTGKINYRRL